MHSGFDEDKSFPGSERRGYYEMNCSPSFDCPTSSKPHRVSEGELEANSLAMSVMANQCFVATINYVTRSMRNFKMHTGSPLAGASSLYNLSAPYCNASHPPPCGRSGEKEAG